MSKTAKKVFLVDALDRTMAYLNADLIMISDMSRPGASGWTAKDVARGLGDALEIEIEHLDLREAQEVSGWDELQHYMSDYFAKSQKDAQNQSVANEKPRVLITLDMGGWKDTGTEGDVDVEVFDFDDYHNNPSAFQAHLPPHFKSLAKQLDIPDDVVAQEGSDEEEQSSPTP